MQLYCCFFIVLLIYYPLTYNLGLDKGGNILFILELLFFVLASKDAMFQYVIKSKISIIWGILVIYHMVNCIAHNVPSEYGYFTYFKPVFSTYVMLNLSCFLLLKDSKTAFRYMITGYTIFILLTFNIVSVDASFDNRLTGPIHPNQFAQCAGMCLLIVAFMKHYMRFNYVTVVLLSIIPLAAIIGCGSRNGFILFVFFLGALLFGNIFSKKVETKKIVEISLLFVCAYLCVIFLLESTSLGDRVLSSAVKAKTYQLGTGTVLDKLGERGYYYVLGWKNFVDNPLTGIGMWNFSHYNNYPYPLHSEYMIHLCEGGIIGAVLYFSFISLFLRGLIGNLIKYKDEYSIVTLMAFGAYMVVGITAREFYYVQFYPVLGLCLYSILKRRLIENHLSDKNTELS